MIIHFCDNEWFLLMKGGHRGRDRMESVPITTNIVSLNSVQGEVYSIQHYVIKYVNDLRQVSAFLRVLHQ